MELSHGWLGLVTPLKGFLSPGHPSATVEFILSHERWGGFALVSFIKLFQKIIFKLKNWESFLAKQHNQKIRNEIPVTIYVQLHISVDGKKDRLQSDYDEEEEEELENLWWTLLKIV